MPYNNGQNCIYCAEDFTASNDCMMSYDSAESASNYEDEETPDQRSCIMEMQPSSSFDEPRTRPRVVSPAFLQQPQTFTSTFTDHGMLRSI